MLAMYVSRPIELQLDLMDANFRLNARHSVMEKAASTNNMTVELSDLAQGLPSHNARSVRLVANLCWQFLTEQRTGCHPSDKRNNNDDGCVGMSYSYSSPPNDGI